MRGSLFIAIGLSLWVVTPAAQATTLLRMDVEALTRASDTVVRGTVTAVSSRWSADHLRILTDVELRVAESLKGTPEPTVTLTQPGGIVGEIGQRVSGLAAFEPGEEVVVFLNRRAPARYDIAGMAQGKYRVERSSDGSAAYAMPASTEDAVLLDPRTREPVEADRHPVALSALRSRIKSAATEEKPARERP